MDSDTPLDVSDEIRERFDWLTRREREVLLLLVDGKTNKAAADALRVSRRTIETHRANILEKLRANSNAELCNLWTRYAPKFSY
ncbi:MAG: response regulator transcription factor [Povalibacter sp.]